METIAIEFPEGDILFPEIWKIIEKVSSPNLKFNGKSDKYNWERMFL